MSDDPEERPDLDDSGAYGREPEAVPVDKKQEQRELEEAGWERLERQGKTVWRNPESGHLYPQGAAIALLRRGVFGGRDKA